MPTNDITANNEIHFLRYLVLIQSLLFLSKLIEGLLPQFFNKSSKQNKGIYISD